MERAFAQSAQARVDVGQADLSLSYTGIASPTVGRVTSVVPGLALAYVRVEVTDDAVLRVGSAKARLH